MGTVWDNSTSNDSRKSRLAQFCLDHASVCVFRLDQDGRILYANRCAGNSLGYSQTELLNISVFDIAPDQNRETWPYSWQQFCEAGSVSLESRLRRKDGTVFPIEVNATLIELEGRRCALALTKDITERKRIYELLRTSQFIFDQAPFGIFLIEESGQIVNVNEHACQYLGYTNEELCRTNIFDIDQGIVEPDKEQLWEREQDQGIVTFESVHRRKDGTDIPVEITGILFKINNENHSVSFVKDISERKEAEQKHQKMEAKMRESQKMESLGTLAGGIAHDFNNILGAILGYAELAQLVGQADSGLKSYISQIHQAGLRAKDLVKQILEFSRQGRSEKGPIDISRVVKEALMLTKAALPANIEILESISPNLAPGFANETQIHQIVMNLCTNAYHAMKAKGGTLTVSLTTVTIHDQDEQNFPQMNPGNYLKLSIADTGYGIPPEMINRIFDPYFTTKPTGEGTGLGLSTTHGIVKDHGGHINVYSEVGRGTTFHVFLPASVATDEAAAEPDEQLPTGSECVLFVDDEKALIDLGRDLLERLGYRVETRVSSIDAIEAFRAAPLKYDLVISDMTMPKMTGDELARQIKAIRSDIPIILCSGFSERIHPHSMEAIGISAVLMKPVIYADLAHTVRQVLETDS